MNQQSVRLHQAETVRVKNEAKESETAVPLSQLIPPWGDITDWPETFQSKGALFSKNDAKRHVLVFVFSNQEECFQVCIISCVFFKERVSVHSSCRICDAVDARVSVDLWNILMNLPASDCLCRGFGKWNSATYLVIINSCVPVYCTLYSGWIQPPTQAYQHEPIPEHLWLVFQLVLSLYNSLLKETCIVLQQFSLKPGF